MELHEYELMSELQTSHWWWLGRRKIIETLIERNLDLTHSLFIGDIGCGPGSNISMLRQYGDVVCLDMHTGSLDKIHDKWGQSVLLHTWHFPETITEKFDLILMSDVLEHIYDDYSMVNWIHEHLKDGGHAVLTVPAHRYLWSQMDEVVHHHRRYEKRELYDLFSKQFEIKKITFYNFFLFPVKIVFAFFLNIFKRLRLTNPNRSYVDYHPNFIGVIFKYILYFESEIISRFSLPQGVSLAILVKKKSLSTQ